VDIEPKSLNIKLPPSIFTWRSQRFLILMAAALSLLVVMPSSLVLAGCTVLVGTPLFWLVFGSRVVFRYTSGMPIVRFFVVVSLVYLGAKLLALAAPWLAKFLGGYGVA
jgi:hypothetical protein